MSLPDRARWADLLPIIQAYADGKQIEFLLDPEVGTWVPLGSDSDPDDVVGFDWPPSCYRIAQPKAATT